MLMVCMRVYGKGGYTDNNTYRRSEINLVLHICTRTSTTLKLSLGYCTVIFKYVSGDMWQTNNSLSCKVILIGSKWSDDHKYYPFKITISIAKSLILFFCFHTQHVILKKTKNISDVIPKTYKDNDLKQQVKILNTTPLTLISDIYLNINMMIMEDLPRHMCIYFTVKFDNPINIDNKTRKAILVKGGFNEQYFDNILPVIIEETLTNLVLINSYLIGSILT